MTSLDSINGWLIQTLLRGENDSKQSVEFRLCTGLFSLERTYVPLRHHLSWTNKVLVGHHHHHVHNANYKSLFSVEPSVSEEILLANNSITVSCKQICPQALHFNQKLQAKRMNFRPTSFQKPLFLACNHVTRRSYWWCVIAIECFLKDLHENEV